MATSKATGSSRLGRDSNPKYLGIKVANGQHAKAGELLVLQHGTHFFAGSNVGMGGNNTLFALRAGTAQFSAKTRTRFDRSKKAVSVVSIIPDKP